MRVPECVVVSAWLGQWRLGAISASDAANAIEAVTGELHVDSMPWLDVIRGLDPTQGPFAPAVPEPGDPCGLPDPSVLGAVAVAPTVLLVQDGTGWHRVSVRHNVGITSLAHAQSQFLTAVEQARGTLERLDTVGGRERVDAALAAMSHPALPPALPPRSRAALDTACRMSVVVDCAISDSAVPSSRSQDLARSDALRDLRRAARDLMLASVTQ